MWKGLPAVHGRITLQLTPGIGKQSIYQCLYLLITLPEHKKLPFSETSGQCVLLLRMFSSPPLICSAVTHSLTFLQSLCKHHLLSEASWAKLGSDSLGSTALCTVLIRTARKWDPKHPFPTAFIARGRGSLSANYTSIQTSLLLWLQ